MSFLNLYILNDLVHLRKVCSVGQQRHPPNTNRPSATRPLRGWETPGTLVGLEVEPSVEVVVMLLASRRAGVAAAFGVFPSPRSIWNSDSSGVAPELQQ